MKFSINQSELNAILNTVSKGAASNATLPILSGILVKAADSNVVFEATDMTTSVRCEAAALVEEEGQAVLPARLFCDVVKNLPDSAVHVEAGLDSANILCDTASFSLKTLDPQDFPGFPEIEELSSITLPFVAFSSMAKRVSRVVSRDDTSPILTGVYIESEGDTLTMVAHDSYHLALERITIEPNDQEFSAVIAGTFINDLASLPKENDTIELALSENQVLARYGMFTFVNRRIEGKYPAYNQTLITTPITTVRFNTKQLLESVKRASLVSANVSPIILDINAASNTTQISSTTHDVGAAQETISSAVEGPDIQIAFGGRFLIEGLTSIDTEEVVLNLMTNTDQGIFTTPAGNYLYLVMPVRLARQR